MPTRFYLPAVGSAAVTIPARADWERSIAAAASRPMGTAKSDTALTDVAALQGSTATGQTRWMSFVSDTLDIDQTITGTHSLVIRGLEQNLAEDAHLAYALRVMVGDTTTERGLLKLQHAAATEFTTAAQTRIFSGVANTSVAAKAGDRIVLEAGIHGVTPGNTGDVTLRFGDPSATADFALTSGLTTDLCPWLELSQNLTFGAPFTSGNRSKNPSFETDATTGVISNIPASATATQDGTRAYAGSWSAKVVVSSTTDYAGIEFHAHLSGLTLTGVVNTARVRFRLWADIGQTVPLLILRWHNSDGSKSEVGGGPIVGNDAWQTLELGPVDSDAAKTLSALSIQTVSNTPGTIWTAWVDDVDLRVNESLPSTGVAIAATISGTSTLTGTVVVAKEITAAVLGTSVTTALVSVAKTIAAAIVATSAVGAAATVAKPIAAAVLGTSSSASAVSVAKPIAAGIAGTSALTGTVSLPISIASAIAGTSALTGTTTVAKAIIAPVVASSATTATVGVSKPISVAIAATSALVAAPTVAKPIASAVVATTATTASVTLAKPVAANVIGSSAATASATVERPITAEIIGTSATSAATTVAKPISSDVIGAASLTGTVTSAPAGTAISASITGSSAVTATATVSRHIVAAISGTSSVVGNATVARPISAEILGTASVSGAIAVTKPITAAVVGAAALTGAVTSAPAGTAISAQIAGSSVVTAATTTAKPIAGDVSGTSTVATSVIVSRPIAAGIAASSAMAAAITVERPIAATIMGVSITEAGVIVPKPIAGDIAGSSALSGVIGFIAPLPNPSQTFFAPSRSDVFFAPSRSGVFLAAAPGDTEFDAGG